LLRYRRRSALHRQRADDQLETRLANLYLDAVTDPRLARWLARRAVDPHATKVDCIGSQRARLEEARSPQPLVDPNAIFAHVADDRDEQRPRRLPGVSVSLCICHNRRARCRPAAPARPRFDT